MELMARDKLLSWLGLKDYLGRYLGILKPHIEQEQILRAEVFKLVFPSPKEGKNSLTLEDGSVLQADYQMTRSLDEAALPAVIPILREAGVRVEELVLWKPTVSLTAYRGLPEELKRIFDQAMETKPKAVTMTIKKSGEPDATTDPQ